MKAMPGGHATANPAASEEAGPVQLETSGLRQDKRAHSPPAENAPACFNGRTPTIGPVKTQTSLAGSERVRRHPRRRT